MKVKILIGSDFPINKKEVRAEAGEVLELPDKVAKALIKNNAAIKFDSKMIIYKVYYSSSPKRFLKDILSYGINIDTSSTNWKIE